MKCSPQPLAKKKDMLIKCMTFAHFSLNVVAYMHVWHNSVECNKRTHMLEKVDEDKEGVEEHKGAGCSCSGVSISVLSSICELFFTIRTGKAQKVIVTPVLNF